MKRSFASLDPQEALHVAIFIEERNAELYHRFAEMFVEFRDSESLEIASVFWEMAAEEKNHSSAPAGQVHRTVRKHSVRPYGRGPGRVDRGSEVGGRRRLCCHP